MNRTIKFRGKRERDGAWVYGDLLTVDVHHACVIKEAGCIVHAVDPATVGQYTGLKDDVGKEVYEGDTMSLGDIRVWVVKFQEGGFVLDPINEKAIRPMSLFYLVDEGAMVALVTGNVYDGPITPAVKADRNRGEVVEFLKKQVNRGLS